MAFVNGETLADRWGRFCAPSSGDDRSLERRVEDAFALAIALTAFGAKHALSRNTAVVVAATSDSTPPILDIC